MTMHTNQERPSGCLCRPKRAVRGAVRKSLMLALVIGFVAAGELHAQIELGADLMSRYVWRGTDFGESPSIQPTLSYSSGGFEIGAWAAYPISAQSFDVNEHNFWLSYSVETPAGEFSIGATDYYFPSAGRFFSFEGGGDGSHFIEPFLSYTGPASFPINLFGGAFLHNDPDRSVYLSASYPVALNGAALSFSVAGTPSQSALYGTDTAAILQVGIGAVKSVQITDRFALPLSAAYLVNPYTEQSFFVFGVSF